MQQTPKPNDSTVGTMSRQAIVFVAACLLAAGTSHRLAAQTVSVSTWSSALDHSLQSVLVFQSQSRGGTDAYIHVYDDIPAQQIAQIDVAAPSGASAASGQVEAPPSMDQEAETLIVHPLMNGAEVVSSAPGSNANRSSMDFLLMTQLSRAVKPKAYRIASAVQGSDDLESLAFRNPDGTYVLLTVNHSTSPVSLEAFWKDRTISCTQIGNSIALFAWDPKSKLVSLVPRQPHILAMGEVSLSVLAKCSKVSPLRIDLQCGSRNYTCSIFPLRFSCDAQPGGLTVSVTAYPAAGNASARIEPGSLTIQGIPDAGEPTSLRVRAVARGEKED